MGNKQSLPVNEAIYHAAKNGKARELEAFLRNARPETSPENLLEWQDDEGRTPLIVAASKDHVDCVELLLRYRANVQHMSRRKEGGTALHEAVFRQCNRRIIETLLRYGASPFVENISKFTAMDYAIVRRDAGLLRRLERCGYFCQYMSVRVRRNFGLSKGWAPKWISIFPRYSYPLRRREPIRRVLLMYNDARSYDPMSKVYLDGSTARNVVGDNGQPQVLLALHLSHIQPKGISVVRDATGQWIMNFRSFEHDPSHVTNLMQAINAQHDIRVEAFDGENDEQLARRIQRHGSFQTTVASQTRQVEQQPPVLQTTHSAPPPAIQPPAYEESEEEIFSPVRVEEEDEEEDQNAPSAPPLPPDYYEPVAQEENQAPPETKFDLLGQDSKELVEDEGLCVICLDKPKTCGFVHGSSMHRCVCQDCALRVKQGGNGLCPICRQPIDHVITNFFL